MEMTISDGNFLKTEHHQLDQVLPLTEENLASVNVDVTEVSECEKEFLRRECRLYLVLEG